MPICPSCNYEYVEGITICPDCNTRVVKKKDLPKWEELSEEDWVLVYKTGDEVEVEMIRANLESAGLEVNVLSQKDHNFPAPGDLSIIKLSVRKANVQEALNFIQDTKQRQDESPDD
jgi:hypothetical protein